MGDIVELTTQPRNQLIFYRTSCHSITFSIKAFGNANVGLAKEPDLDHISHWVYIGRNGKSGILENNQIVLEADTPNIVSNNGFKKFWLTWYGHKIQFGKEGDTEPILSHKIKRTRFKYITFSEVDEQNSVCWKFLLPPSIERPKLKPIEGGKPHWVRYDGLLPYGAMIGGFENEFLFIMRAPHEGSLTPGKFVPSTQCGFVSWGGEMHLKTEFEILCAIDCVWVKTKEDIVPSGAIKGGYTEHPGTETMYVGRAEYEGHLIPGKIAPSYNVCFFPYNNEECSRDCYEILVAPYSSPRYNETKFETYKFDNYREQETSEDDDDDRSGIFD